MTGSFNIAVVPANPALETSETAIVAVEFIDTAETVRDSRRHALREVVRVRTLPASASTQDIIGEVAEMARDLGGRVRVIVNKAGSASVRDDWTDAARYPLPLLDQRPYRLTIGGDGFGWDGLGDPVISEGELVRTLRELVKTRAFEVVAEGGAALMSSAMSIDPSVTDAGRLRFPSRHRDGRVFALAVALYPRLHPSHDDRRFRTEPTPTRPADTFESYAAAVAAIGSAASRGPVTAVTTFGAQREGR